MEEQDEYKETAIKWGYVPRGCKRSGYIILVLKNRGEDPCDLCSIDRKECKGRPRKDGTL